MKTIRGHEASIEILKFKQDFEFYTGISVMGLIESHDYFHWKRLVFEKLDCVEMLHIANYIKQRFSTVGKYTHLMPALCTYDGYLTLTIDVKYIIEYIHD